MSVEQQESTMATDNSLKAGVNWVAKFWPRVRLGHEGLMLDKIDRQNRIVETLARNTMTGNMKDVAGWPGNEGGDAMGVNIGDHTHYHQAPAQTAVSAPTTSTLSKWLPYLLAAAAAVGGYFVGDRQTLITMPQQPASVNLDKDIYGIRLEHYKPEPSE